MTPSALRELIATLPWDQYTDGELNELHAICMSTTTTIRNCRATMRRLEMQRRMSERVMLTPEEAQAQMTKAQMYPRGSRFE